MKKARKKARKKANKSEKKRKKSEKKREKSAHNFIKTGEGGSKAIYKLYKKNRQIGTEERPLPRYQVTELSRYQHEKPNGWKFEQGCKRGVQEV